MLNPGNHSAKVGTPGRRHRVKNWPANYHTLYELCRKQAYSLQLIAYSYFFYVVNI